MIKYTNTKVIDVDDWDNLVQKTYGRPYSFQQQDGCKDRGTFKFQVPSKWELSDYKNETIPENANDEERGVSFEAWLARDPKQKLTNQEDYLLGLWWERNFYPDVSMVIDDLYKKKLIEAGDYVIDINW